MIKVVKRKDVYTYPNIKDDITYYIDEFSLQIKDDGIAMVTIADVYMTKNKEGRIGMVPVEWFKRQI